MHTALGARCRNLDPSTVMLPMLFHLAHYGFSDATGCHLRNRLAGAHDVARTSVCARPIAAASAEYMYTATSRKNADTAAHEGAGCPLQGKRPYCSAHRSRTLERYLHTKRQAEALAGRREALIPLLDHLERVAHTARGVIGMAHRGRLNV
jgi:hypothetical protein